MITVEAWTTIRYLHAQGKSIRAIAKDVGVARNTVRSALHRSEAPTYVRPKRPNPKLQPFLSDIQRMLFEKGFIGTRILRELRVLGYEGGKTALYSHLRQLKADLPDPRITERFETPPARQGQFDWSSYNIPLGDQIVRVVIYCLTLAFSRRKFYWASLNETQASIFEALVAALHHFGGSPKELLIDNPRSFVTNADPANFVWNPHFLQLCGHYSIEPVPCQPGRPRTKGKVERPFFYLEQHFIKGNSWESFDHFNSALAQFTANELDQMVHSTTLERPIERFEREKSLLTPLPACPFIGSNEQIRKVSWDCLVSFDGSRYSVPWQYAGKQVWLRPSQGVRLTVRNSAGEEIARHRLSDKKGATVINPMHYEGLRKDVPKTRVLLEERFIQLFPDHKWFFDALFGQHKNNGPAQMRSILALAEVYPYQALLSAFAAARQYNTYSERFIRGLLESGRSSHCPSPEGSDTQPKGYQVAQLIPLSASRGYVQRVGADLKVYQHILEAGR
jgi:transposase